MPKHKTPPAPPPEDPVDVDQFDEIDDDELPDEFDLQDLEPVFTEEAPIPDLDDGPGPDEDLPQLEEDATLGVEAPLELDSDEGEDSFEPEEEALAEVLDWVELTDEVPAQLPVLDWSQQVFVEELGRTLHAELDPTAESTTWFRPDVSRAAHRLTFALGGEEISAFPSLVRSREERLRIGRDVLSGRFLVRC